MHISRVADIVDWKTKQYKTHFPAGLPDGSNVFLDTVSFTGRTIEETAKRVELSAAVVEIAGRYAKKKCEKIGVPLMYSTDVSDYQGLWHLDDMARWIETTDGAIPPSQFIRTAYENLYQSKEPEEFSAALISHNILREQPSPNLFLELSRPASYLARSFTQDPERVREVLPFIKVLESLYTNKQRGTI